MSVKRVVLLGWMALMAAFCVTGRAALPSYSFTDFEADTGWKIGPFPDNRPDFKLIQGKASIASYPERNSQQILQLGPSKPFPALFVDASAASKGITAYCEVLAKPFALDQNSDEEFLNFGGAILGFFRAGNQGEIRALFANSEKESVWISTGLRFNLDETGLSVQWLRLTVKLNRETGRWDLQIDGEHVLSGLKAVPGMSGGLALWLYGDESHPYFFDDILLSADDPDRLEKMIAWQNERRAMLQTLQASQLAAKTVVQTKEDSDLRQSQPSIDKAARQLTAPVLRDWSAILQSGGVITRSGSNRINAGGMSWGVMPYSVQYGDNNKPLPVTLTIVADTELKPGTDLSKLRWIVAEMSKWPNEIGDVMATGDFSSGLVQTVPMSGKWLQVATCVDVWGEGGANDIRKAFKFKNGILPEALRADN